MAVDIPLKAKYRPPAKLYGYPRRHNGSSAKKVAKGQKMPAVYSYDRTKHVLQVDGLTGHAVMVHYK
jgi:hypothetical protein